MLWVVVRCGSRWDDVGGMWDIVGCVERCGASETLWVGVRHCGWV